MFINNLILYLFLTFGCCNFDSLDKFWGLKSSFFVSSLSFGFQVADTKQKRKKGVFGKQGGDKEV